MYLGGTGICVSSGKKIKRTSHTLITGDSISKVIPPAREQRGLFIRRNINFVVEMNSPYFIKLVFNLKHALDCA